MNKFHKGKAVGIMTASLATVALIGVGFSTWIISTRNTQSTGNVTVSVGDIQDKRITIELVKDNDVIDGVKDGTICFDAQTTDTTGDIQYTGDKGGEDLSFSISYIVKLGAALSVSEFPGIQANFEMVESNNSAANTAFTTAITNNYFVMPIDMKNDTNASNKMITNRKGSANTALGKDSDKDAIVTTVTVNPSETETKKEHTLTYTTTFNIKWGDYFNKTNPGLLGETGHPYSTTTDKNTDGTNKTAQNTSDVVTALNELYKANQATFKINLSVAEESASATE